MEERKVGIPYKRVDMMIHMFTDMAIDMKQGISRESSSRFENLLIKWAQFYFILLCFFFSYFFCRI